VAEIGLETDVEETEDGEDLVDDGITDGGVDIGSNEEILDDLQEFHGEEEKDTGGKGGVVGLGPDPPGGEEADGCESSRHFHRETHIFREISFVFGVWENKDYLKEDMESEFIGGL